LLSDRCPTAAMGTDFDFLVNDISSAAVSAG
jgi:hypothetical protein